MNIIQSFRKAALAVLLAGLCGAASASVAHSTTVVSIGNNDQTFAAGSLGENVLWGLRHLGIDDSVVDTITFSLGQNSDFSLYYASPYVHGLSDISAFSIALDGSVLTSLISSTHSSDFYGIGTGLAAGSHTLTISNVGSLVLGGIYRLQMVASAVPVPEPGSWALMLGGVGLVGMLARRRIAG